MSDGKDTLRLVFLEGIIAAIKKENSQVRADGAPGWKALKEAGFPHQQVPSPAGGPALGRLEFQGGTPQIDVDETAVLAYARQWESRAAVEEYVEPTVWTRADVIAAVRKIDPVLVQTRVRDSIRTGLVEEAKKNGGRVLHPDGSGEFTVIGTVTKSPVEGKVRWCPNKDTTDRIMAMLANGTAGDLGLWVQEIAPPAPAPAPPAAIVQAVPEPEGPAEPASPPKLRLGKDVYHQVTFDDLDTSAPEPEAADQSLPPYLVESLSSAVEPSPELFADEDGFLNPELAAAHAIIVQGGFTDPQREAYRMIRDGGVAKERALAWLRARDLPEDPPARFAA